MDADEEKVLGSSSGGSGGTEESSPVLRFFGPRRMGSEVAVGSKPSDTAAVEGGTVSEAAAAWAGERLPVTRLRGPDEAARAAPLEERLTGPEAGPRRGAALWRSGTEAVK